MSLCVIFGGAGFIGVHLAKRLLETKRFSHVHLADIRPLNAEVSAMEGVSYSQTDVRKPIPTNLVEQSPDWIFNFAAIHREPGHEGYEYFETNLQGAEHVCTYAEETGCPNIYFTSSISVYGPVINPTDESKMPSPITPYGGSKYPAELIHRCWRERGKDRKLRVVRPGVVYGPGDPGNIMRMIQAIRKGYFAFPGSKHIHKSYAYIYGLLDSMEFVMDRAEPYITYNYVETPTQTISEIAEITKRFFNSKAPILSLPSAPLRAAASVMQAVGKDRNPVHPVRVKKAGTPTHIVPQKLKDLGFEFKYDFEQSLKHWLEVQPSDFE